MTFGEVARKYYLTSIYIAVVVTFIAATLVFDAFHRVNARVLVCTGTNISKCVPVGKTCQYPGPVRPRVHATLPQATRNMPNGGNAPS